MIKSHCHITGSIQDKYAPEIFTHSMFGYYIPLQGLQIHLDLDLHPSRDHPCLSLLGTNPQPPHEC